MLREAAAQDTVGRETAQVAERSGAMKVKLRGRTIKLKLRLKAKELKYIVVTSLVFWVAMTNQGQKVDVGKLMTQPEKTVPTVAQSETAEEISDTGCNGAGYEICDSAEEGTMPES